MTFRFLSNHINKYFDDYEYSSDTKEYPNVSLIEDTGELIINAHPPLKLVGISDQGRTYEVYANYDNMITNNDLDEIYYVFEGNGEALVAVTAYTDIDTYAFDGTSNSKHLTAVTIADGVNTIDQYAFSDCFNLQYLIFECLTPPTLNGVTFNFSDNWNQVVAIYVPDEAVTDYEVIPTYIWSSGPWAATIYGMSNFDPTNPTKAAGATDYLTFRALEEGTFGWYAPSGISNTVQYSLDGGQTWDSLSSGETTPTIGIGDKVIWKASGLAIDACITCSGTNMKSGIGRFSSSGHFNLEGNIMSLVSGDSFSTASQTIADYQFSHLFSCRMKGNMVTPISTMVVNAENLVLPALTVGERSYKGMFHFSDTLVSVPKLPATTLGNFSYGGMFEECTELTVVSSDLLPVTTLAEHCYDYMFYHTNIMTAPELPATTLASYCYGYMFYGCSNLRKITCLATDISATGCTYSWVSNVNGYGQFYKNPNMNSWTTGPNGIPNGWTVVNA